MEYSITWNPTYAETVWVLISAAFCFALYFFVSQSKAIENFLKKKGYKESSDLVYSRRLIGVFFLGIVPFFLVLIGFEKEIWEYGVQLPSPSSSLLWIPGIAAIIIPLSWFGSQKEDNLSMYPQVRNAVWSSKTVFFSALTWIAYLIAYEYLFRGFLLFGCAGTLGVWPAIAINVAFYSLAHIPKGPKEAFGAIPLGFVLCLLTLQTGSILIATAIHIVMALSNDWFSLYHHPDIRLE